MKIQTFFSFREFEIFNILFVFIGLIWISLGLFLSRNIFLSLFNFLTTFWLLRQQSEKTVTIHIKYAIHILSNRNILWIYHYYVMFYITLKYFAFLPLSLRSRNSKVFFREIEKGIINNRYKKYTYEWVLW